MSWMFHFSAVFAIILSLYAQRSGCATGTVKLDPLPEAPEYKASGVEYDDGGMGPMFDFARSFINTALPGGFPADFINETITNMGSQDILQLAQKLLNQFKGYVAAIAVGVLFIVTVPIVGACFCCCRLCGNCGGKRFQEPTDGMHCKRRVFACILFVTTVFILVGNICTYVNNGRMTTALEKVAGIIDSNLDDIDTFLDLTVEQAKVIGVKNLGTTRVAIESKLDKDVLKKEISGFAVNFLANGALDKMDAQIQSAVKAFDTVANRTAEASKAYTDMKTSCSPATCAALNGVFLNDPLSSGGLKTAERNRFDAFRQNDAVKRVKDEIGAQVDSSIPDLSATKTDVKSSFDLMQTKVNKYVQEIESFKTQAKDGIDIQSYKDKARDYTETAQTYDKYRNIGGTVLGAIITLIVSLQFFGMVFGSVGQSLRTLPTDRGCVSNSGGNLLIASVAFIFLFSWLLMLLTTITFAVGAILERFVCQPLAPPDFELLKVADKQFDTKEVFGASLATVLRDCRDGKAAYEAFHLKSKGFDLKDLDDKLAGELQKIDGKMDTALQTLSSSSSIGTGSAANQAGTSLQELHGVLNAINYGIVDTLMGNLAMLPNAGPSVAKYKESMVNLGTALKDLEKIKDQVQGWRSDFTQSLNTVSANIGSKMTQVTDGFKKEILHIADSYVNDTKEAIRNKIGKCTPLWNLYDSVIGVSVCKYIVDAFNGFWFSIGWCLFFFVPSIIFSVKLSKHYHTMNSDEESVKTKGETNYAYDSGSNEHFRSNKVGHADVPDSQY